MIVTFNLPDNERIAVKATDVHAVAKDQTKASVLILRSDRKSADSFTLADTFDEAVAKWRAALQPATAPPEVTWKEAMDKYQSLLDGSSGIWSIHAEAFLSWLLDQGVISAGSDIDRQSVARDHITQSGTVSRPRERVDNFDNKTE